MGLIERIILIIQLVSSALITHTEGFEVKWNRQHRIPTSALLSTLKRNTRNDLHNSIQRNKNRGTSLSMGLRSLLGIGKNKREDGGNNEKTDNDNVISESDNTTSDINGSTEPETSSTTGPFKISSPPPLRMGEDPMTKEVNVHSLDPSESIQERINRVKSGKMTEEEKKSFLKTALSAGNTAESRKPLLDPVYDSKEKRRVFASPFPSDSILRNFARGNKPPQEDVNAAQRKKKEYLDMVTNPDRFSRYRALPKDQLNPRPVNQTTATATSAPPGQVENRRAASNTNANRNPSETGPSDLGARLGAAALANENLRQQQLKQQAGLQQQQLADQRRREYERQAEEQARQRQAEMQQLEMQQQARRRKQEVEKQREEERKKQAEKERLDQLMKAQEEYWNKKLAAEREARAMRLKEEEKMKQQKKVAPPAPVANDTVSVPQQSESTVVTVPSQQVSPSASSGSVFNPDESSILSSSKTAGGSSTAERENDFIAEQTRRKSQIDRAREMQLQRLKELNSPLPNAPSTSPPPWAAASGRPTSPQPLQQNSQQRAPSLSNGATQKSNLDRSSPTKKDGFDQIKSVTSSQGKRRDEALSATVTKSAVNQQQTDDPASVPPAKSPWSTILGLGSKSNDNARENKVEKPQSTTTTKINSVSNATETSPPPPPQPKQQQPQRKGPIRMALPISDDDDAGDDGVDVSSNKKMSIAEAMKRTTDSGNIDQGERAKKWGIDMSRFQD